MRTFIKKQDGFTLLELLIVIVIIGILALIIVPGLASGPKRARDAQRKSDMRAVKNALETYYNDNNAYPVGATYGTSDTTGIGTNLVSSYLPHLPIDPKNTGVYVYSYNGTATTFTLQAHVENTKDSQIKSGTTDTYEVTSVN